MSDKQPPEPSSVVFQMGVPEHLESGAYANNMAVWNTAYEFTLDFAVTLPVQLVQEGDDKAPAAVVPCKVVARVKIPPTVIFNVIKALNENMTAYERAFGEIKRPGEEEPMYPPDILPPDEEGQP